MLHSLFQTSVESSVWMKVLPEQIALKFGIYSMYKSKINQFSEYGQYKSGLPLPKTCIP